MLHPLAYTLERNTPQHNYLMCYLSLLHYYYGIEIWKQPNLIFMPQTRYAWEILEKFHMTKCKPSLNPMEANARLLVMNN